VGNTILYLANLIALQQWYIHVRHPFFQTQEFGDPIYAGVLDILALAKTERIRRLNDLAGKVEASLAKGTDKNPDQPGRRELCTQIDPIQELFTNDAGSTTSIESRDHFLSAFLTHKKEHGTQYIECIQRLPITTSSKGVQWLEGIVTTLCNEASAMVPSLDIFRK
jgi:UDP-N-acetylglucosamine/UDP-N-acetylgalactosamine diphosphorylase